VGNRISVLGPSTLSFHLLEFLQPWTSFAQPITVEGNVVFEDNSIEFENGLLDAATNPRVQMVLYRPPSQIGGGYRIRVRGLPCFYAYLSAATSAQANSASRHALEIRDVTGKLIAQQSAGAFSRVTMTNCVGPFVVAVPTSGAGYTPVGDEAIVLRDEVTNLHDFFTMAGVRQPAFLLTNTVGGSSGYLQVQNGAGNVFLSSQGATNVSITLAPRGTGVVASNTPVQFKGYLNASLPSASTYNASTIRIADRQHRLATSDGTNWQSVALTSDLPTNNADYVIGATQPGVTGAAQKLLVHKLPHAITFPASLAGSYMTALTAATASTVFTLAYKRGGTTTTIGVFTFAAGGTDATISGVVIPTLAAADIVMLSGPATADATLADIGASFLASKQ